MIYYSSVGTMETCREIIISNIYTYLENHPDKKKEEIEIGITNDYLSFTEEYLNYVEKLCKVTVVSCVTGGAAILINKATLEEISLALFLLSRNPFPNKMGEELIDLGGKYYSEHKNNLINFFTFFGIWLLENEIEIEENLESNGIMNTIVRELSYTKYFVEFAKRFNVEKSFYYISRSEYTPFYTRRFLKEAINLL